MARPPNTDERRQQITMGLMQVMARRGYDGASVASIAEAAGIGQGLVHYHFRSKQEILLELLEELVTRHEARLDELFESRECSSRERVARFIDAHLGLAAADPDALACWILLSGEALRQPAVQEPYAAALARIVERLRTMIVEGVRRGELACRDAREAATAIVAAIQGYFVLAATARELVAKGSAARSVRRMADGLLGASPAGASPAGTSPAGTSPAGHSRAGLVKARGSKTRRSKGRDSSARSAKVSGSKVRRGPGRGA